MPVEKRISRGLLQRVFIDSKELFEGRTGIWAILPQQGIHWIKAQDGRFKASVVKLKVKS